MIELVLDQFKPGRIVRKDHVLSEEEKEEIRSHSCEGFNMNAVILVFLMALAVVKSIQQKCIIYMA
jgi:hypothetical protein